VARRSDEMYLTKDEEGRRTEGERFLGLRKVKYLQRAVAGADRLAIVTASLH